MRSTKLSILGLGCLILGIPASVLGVITIEDVAPGNLSTPIARQVAFLTSDGEGNQSIVARHVFDRDTVGKDRIHLAGETFGIEVTIDGTGIWGVNGQAVDVMVSAVTKQDSLLVLLDSGHIVEMRGIWGTNGTAMLPSEVITHAPAWDMDRVGAATSFVEGIRDVDDGTFEYQDPFIAIGTDMGNVGIVGVPDIDDWQVNPDTFENGALVSLGDPLINVGDGPVKDLALHPIANDWVPMVDDWYPQPADWADGLAEWVGPTDDWFPDVDDWFPADQDFFPQVDDWYEIAALVDGEVSVFFPGVRNTGAQGGAVPLLPSFVVDTSAIAPDLLGIAGIRLSTQLDLPIIDIPADLDLTPLFGVNGGENLQIGALGPLLGKFDPINILSTLPVGLSVSGIEAGSVWLLSDDGQTVIYLPEFDFKWGGPGTGGDAVGGGGVRRDAGMVEVAERGGVIVFLFGGEEFGGRLRLRLG